MNTLKSALACMLVVMAGGRVLSGTTAAYEETFDRDTGTFVIDNGTDPSAGWAFDASCPPATSAPIGAGVLRWGEFGDCSSYGQTPHTDQASTPTVTTFECTLSFNYHLDYEEPVTFENADVEVTADGSPQPLLSLANGTLMSAGTWLNATAPLPDGAVSVQFIGSTDDGSFNSGTGWSIDDVTFDCNVVCANCTTPATGGWGVLVLVAGFSLAMLWTLTRQRRSSTLRSG